MITGLTKAEEWILESMVIQHLRMKSQGEYGDLIWSPGVIADRIPPILTKELRTVKEINDALIKLIQANYAEMHGQYISEVNCIVTPNGVLTFKNSLIPLAEKVKDKKLFNNILDRTLGNEEVKKELKSLGDEVRDRLESEIIDALLRFMIRRGPDAISYILNLLND